MFVERIGGTLSALIGLIIGILVMVAAAGTATAEVRASSAYTGGVPGFTYDESAARAVQGFGQASPVVTDGVFDPSSPLGGARFVGAIYGLSVDLVAPSRPLSHACSFSGATIVLMAVSTSKAIADSEWQRADALGAGRTRRVDVAWIRHFPGDKALLGGRISMHHIGGGRLTVPLPHSRHLDARMPGGFRYNPGGPGANG